MPWLSRAILKLMRAFVLLMACFVAAPLSVLSGIRDAEILQADGETMVRLELLVPATKMTRLHVLLVPSSEEGLLPRGSMRTRERRVLENMTLPAGWPWRSHVVRLPQGLVGGTYRVVATLQSGQCPPLVAYASRDRASETSQVDCLTDALWTSAEFDLSSDPQSLAAWLHDAVKGDMLAAAAKAAGLPVELQSNEPGTLALGTHMGDWRSESFVASFPGDDLCVTGAFPEPAPGSVTACIHEEAPEGKQDHYLRSDVRISTKGFVYPRGIMSYEAARKRAAGVLGIAADRWYPQKVRYISAEPEGYWLFEKTMDRTIAILPDGLVCREETRKSHVRCANLVYEICDGMPSEIGPCSRFSW